MAGERLRQRITGPDGNLHPQLAPVLDLIDARSNPVAMMTWLYASQWGKALGHLAALNATITHDLLDQQPGSARIVHLRAVLTYAGVLPPRDEYIESSVAWLDHVLATQTDEIVTVIRPYATWSVLRRARHRARRRESSRSVTKYNRNLITLAIQLMNWSAGQSIPLSLLTQADLERWLVNGSINRQRVRDFLRWTYDQGLSRKLTIPVGSRTQPHQFLEDDHRWQILRQCAHDTTISPDLRAGAALVLLFGLTPTRITRLTTHDVTSKNGRTYLTVGTSPLTVPASIAPLFTQLADRAGRHRPPIIDRPDQVNAWLFPGSLPGRHTQPATLTSRMASAFGLKIRTARNAALCDLAQDIPAPVLAELLGLQIEAAIRWSELVKTDWSAYLAARPQPPTP